MPRRQLPTARKTDADIARAIAEYRSPADRKRDRLERFLPQLVALRRGQAPWLHLLQIVEDVDHRYSVIEIREAVEPLVDSPSYIAPSPNSLAAKPSSPALKPPPTMRTATGPKQPPQSGSGPSNQSA